MLLASFRCNIIKKERGYHLCPEPKVAKTVPKSIPPKTTHPRSQSSWGSGTVNKVRTKVQIMSKGVEFGKTKLVAKLVRT